jgi:hypothetical protein
VRRALILTIFLLAVGLSTEPALADTFTFTASGTPSFSGGLPVSATATFTTGNGTILITLTNTQVNPTSVIQNLSDISFAVSTGQNSGTLTWSSGQELTVYGDATYSTGSTVSTGWVLTTNGSQFELTALGTATAPTHTIIGPPDSNGYYSNANGSVAGNGPHNPFLAGPVTFDLNIPGVTTDSTITNVTFSFGTVADSSATLTAVPEPSALLLMGSGLLALGGLMRRRLRR